jgi:hypothetical protein
MADSIDQTQHVIYDDTAALGLVIRQLDNPMGRVFKHSTLGKAYYYMGRNHSLSNRIAEAAKCYIEADRLHIDAPIYCGRVNSCMGYICRQNNNDSLALIFYERASETFKEGGDEWRYAQSILNTSENYISLHQFLDADSILQIAGAFHLDVSYIARFYETRGLYFYEHQQYYSALVYFRKGFENWESDADKCYSSLKIAQVYYDKNDLVLSIPYAQFIITHTKNLNFISNAYYCMMLEAQEKNDSQLVSKYSHARIDALKSLREIANKYAEAMPLLEKYLSNPNPWRWIRIALVLLMFVCLLSIVAVIVYRKRTVSAYIKMDALSIHLKEQEDVVLELKHIQDCEKLTNKIRAKYPTPLNAWNDYTMLKKDLNPYLYNFLNALEDWKLTNREKVFCVFIYVYPQLPTSELAKYLYISKEAAQVCRARIVKKIGITSLELLDFLKRLSITNN